MKRLWPIGEWLGEKGLEVILALFEAFTEGIGYMVSRREMVWLCLYADVVGKILIDEGVGELHLAFSGKRIESIEILFHGSFGDVVYEIRSDKFSKNFWLYNKKKSEKKIKKIRDRTREQKWIRTYKGGIFLKIQLHVFLPGGVEGESPVRSCFFDIFEITIFCRAMILSTGALYYMLS
jgi:hypothetical protein